MKTVLAVASAAALSGMAPRETPAGEGIFCAAALYSAAAEVGRQCFPSRSPEVQAELATSVQKLDAYIMANSATTPAQLAEFKRMQGSVGIPKEALCHGDAVGIFEAIEGAGAERLRTSLALLVARPGKPTLGDCL